MSYLSRNHSHENVFRRYFPPQKSIHLLSPCLFNTSCQSSSCLFVHLSLFGNLDGTDSHGILFCRIEVIAVAPSTFWLNSDTNWGTRWLSWLRHCATSQKVAVSILNVVTGIFHWLIPSSRTMTLGSTQPVPAILPGGQRRMIILPFLCTDCLEIWEPQPSGTLRKCPGLYRDCGTFTFGHK